jgi:hypothetical protein
MHYAEPTIEAIDAIPSNITLLNEGCCKEARESYNGISPDTQAYVTNYDKLFEAEAAYEELFAPVDAFRNDNIKSSLMFDYSATIT